MRKGEEQILKELKEFPNDMLEVVLRIVRHLKEDMHIGSEDGKDSEYKEIKELLKKNKSKVSPGGDKEGHSYFSIQEMSE